MTGFISAISSFTTPITQLITDVIAPIDVTSEEMFREASAEAIITQPDAHQIQTRFAEASPIKTPSPGLKAASFALAGATTYAVTTAARAQEYYLELGDTIGSSRLSNLVYYGSAAVVIAGLAFLGIASDILLLTHKGKVQKLHAKNNKEGLKEYVNGKNRALAQKAFEALVDLGQNNFSDLNLSGLDFSKYRNTDKFKNARFVDCNMASANLEGIDLGKAVLTTANLRNANLSFANLQKANLDKADLRGTNLANADLYNTAFEKAQFDDNTNFHDATILASITLFDIMHTGKWPKSSPPQLRGINLTDLMCTNYNLEDADLSNATIKNCYFDNLNLSQSTLNGASIIGGSLKNINLSKASLKRIVIQQVVMDNIGFRNTDFTDADLSKALLQNVHFYGSDLIRVKFPQDCEGISISPRSIDRQTHDSLIAHKGRIVGRPVVLN